MKTKILTATQDGAIEAAVETLMTGGLVAVPTETVYGLAGDALNSAAVKQIYAAKGRPALNPLICHVANEDMAARLVVLSPAAQHLMAHFWPGPLTLVLPAKADSGVAPEVSAGLETLAVRCPAHPVTHAVIKALGRPVAAPSANPSGLLSPTSAEDVMAGLAGKIPLILDGGVADVGLESTIIAVTDNSVILLRPGTILIDEIAEIAALPVRDRDETKISAPGQLASHYAPKARVFLNQTTQDRDTNAILLGFGPVKGDVSLSESGDLKEAAHNLFAMMRRADETADVIYIAPIPETGIGLAINDRLRRAAAPRTPASHTSPQAAQSAEDAEETTS